jgi:hypothetical protein
MHEHKARGFVSHVALLCVSSALVACVTDNGGSVEDEATGGVPVSTGASSSTGAVSGATGGAATGGTSTGGVGTGGTATGGAATGGDGTGGQGSDPCADGEWTCVPVDASGAYGTKTFDVPAQQNWVNTGLFLKKGQTATVSATGTWSVEDEGDTIDHGPCKVGDVVARIGLHYKDIELTCVGSTVTFTAPRDGILFVGALTGNDLGETYESRYNASGAKQVTVESTVSTLVPTVQSVEAADYPFDDVGSGWVEVWGEHVILTLPSVTAKADALTLRAATERLDAIYELHEQLRGDVPQHGQRLRFYPDPNIDGIGYMLAGNPIRMLPELVDVNDSDRISRAGEPGVGNWGFAHEMGHDFSWSNGFWSYEQNTIEVWCNVFSVHAMEKLGLPLHGSTQNCTSSSSGSYAGGSWDPWTGLCFLRQFQFDYGWEFYEQYFRSINENTDMPWKGDWDKTAWYFVHDQFETIAGEDVTPAFAAWSLPHP